MFRVQPFNIRDGYAEKGREVLEKVFDVAMDQPFNPLGKVSGALSSFRVDVTENDDKYEIYAELPGFTKEEITVSYDDNSRLSVSAQHIVEDEDAEGVKYVCRERKRGKFEREFFVDDIAADETTVSFENGLLHIVLPKLAADRNKKIFDIN